MPARNCWIFRLSTLLGLFVLGLLLAPSHLMARGGFGGGGRGGMGGGAPRGGGSFSRPGGGGGYSHVPQARDVSRPANPRREAGPPSRPTSTQGPRQATRPQPAKPSASRIPSSPSRTGERRPDTTHGAAQLPSRAAESPSRQPARTASSRPSQLPATHDRAQVQRPTRTELNNFLGVSAGAASGAALGTMAGQHPSQLPSSRPGWNRPGEGERSRRAPEQRADWAERSQNRDAQWKQRVDNRDQAWNNWQQKNQSRLDQFSNRQDERWDQINNAREDRQSWRDQNREDWQSHREELWDYRSDRANQVWDRAEDYYDNLFDDRWWGAWAGVAASYATNPWWWWQPATYESAASFVQDLPAEPTYIDYGMNVDYEGNTVYVNNQPVPAKQYFEPLARAVENQPDSPPPTPPTPKQEAEWMPLGVFALVQEEKGDPTMFFQLSINRSGILSGAYSNTLSGDQMDVTGQIDKKSQRVLWRIGERNQTLFESTLANLTLDVSPVAVHFNPERTQTWLLVRMPEPAPAGGAPGKLPSIDQKPPPLGKQK